MTVSEKIKKVDNKTKHSKAQYDLDRQTAKISALFSGNVSKSEFFTGKDVAPEKNLLEKAATMKSFEYSPFGSRLKKETEIAEKQYKRLDNTYKIHEIIKKNTVFIKFLVFMNIIIVLKILIVFLLRQNIQF